LRNIGIARIGTNKLSFIFSSEEPAELFVDAGRRCRYPRSFSGENGTMLWRSSVWRV
jgi:hypothetical protein